LAFGGIGLAIAAGARVLVPRMRTLKHLAEREGRGRGHFMLRTDPALELFRDAPELLRPFTSVEELWNERERFLDVYSGAYRRWSEHPTKAHANILDKARGAGQEVEDVAQDVINWSNYAAVARVYKDARLVVFLGVIMAGVGMTIFALKIPDVPPAAPIPAAVQLQGLQLRGSALFKGQRLQGADLSKADFTNANLTKADLSGAKLDGTKFDGANLSLANLHGATGLTPAAVVNAQWDATTCPDGRSSDDVGKSCEAHLVPVASG
jgi:pentapeptide repeat protein